jgi:hypothetical protein
MQISEREREIMGTERVLTERLTRVEAEAEILRKKINHLEALFEGKHHSIYCEYCKWLELHADDEWARG